MGHTAKAVPRGKFMAQNTYIAKKNKAYNSYQSSHLNTSVKKKGGWNSHCGSVVTNPTSIHKDTELIPGPAQ